MANEIRPNSPQLRAIDDAVTLRLRAEFPDMDWGLTWDESDAEMAATKAAAGGRR